MTKEGLLSIARLVNFGLISASLKKENGCLLKIWLSHRLTHPPTQSFTYSPPRTLTQPTAQEILQMGYTTGVNFQFQSHSLSNTPTRSPTYHHTHSPNHKTYFTIGAYNGCLLSISISLTDPLLNTSTHPHSPSTDSCTHSPTQHILPLGYLTDVYFQFQFPSITHSPTHLTHTHHLLTHAPTHSSTHHHTHSSNHSHNISHHWGTSWVFTLNFNCTHIFHKILHPHSPATDSCAQSRTPLHLNITQHNISYHWRLMPRLGLTWHCPILSSLHLTDVKLRSTYKNIQLIKISRRLHGNRWPELAVKTTRVRLKKKRHTMKYHFSVCQSLVFYLPGYPHPLTLSTQDLHQQTSTSSLLTTFLSSLHSSPSWSAIFVSPTLYHCLFLILSSILLQFH